jgi:hypothetical protein
VELAPVDFVPPAITGTAQDGQTLSASAGSWLNGPASYTYQWQDCDGTGGSCTTISGATSGTYALRSGDVGHTVRTVVTATNAGGSTPAASSPTAVVSPMPAPSNTALPVLGGSAVQGQALVTSAGSWTNGPASYTYQWEDCDSSGGSCQIIGGATTSSYALAAGDVGHTVRAVVTAHNDGGPGSATSAPSSVVTGNTGVSCSQTVGSEAAIVSAVGSAPGGSTVCIAGGSYGAMTWTGGGSRTSPVTVVPVPGASVVFTGPLKEDASYVTLESVNLSGQRWEIDGPTSNVTMENITAANFWIGSQPAGGVRNITVLGGSLGPNHTYPDNIIGSNGSSAVNSNVVIDGVLFHDQTRSSSSSHFECLQVWNADGLTIQNSKFENCSVFSIELQHVGVGSTSYPPPTPTNVTIQNNWLDCCTDFTTGVNTYSKNFSVLFASDDGEGSWKNIVVRNNSGDDGLDFGSPSADAVSYSNVRVENNAMPNWNVNAAGSSSAPAGISVDYNEWFQGSKVGAHDLGAALPTSIFTGWAGGHMPGLDLHEVAGAPTVGKGDPSFYPPTDIDGNPRTSPPDIGAFQLPH